MHSYSKFSIALLSLSISSFSCASKFYEEDDKFSTNSTWSTEFLLQLDDGGQEDYQENTRKANRLATGLARSINFVAKGYRTPEQHRTIFASIDKR